MLVKSKPHYKVSEIADESSGVGGHGDGRSNLYVTKQCLDIDREPSTSPRYDQAALTRRRKFPIPAAEAVLHPPSPRHEEK